LAHRVDSPRRERVDLTKMTLSGHRRFEILHCGESPD
jgi:hypothetical protein